MSDTVFRCGECGNEIGWDDVPDLSDGEGSKGRVSFGVSPVCHHGLPYTMSAVPASEPNRPRRPKALPQ